jgi:hypothetical protein
VPLHGGRIPAGIPAPKEAKRCPPGHFAGTEQALSRQIASREIRSTSKHY